MRELKVREIEDAVSALCIQANRVLPEDLHRCMACAGQAEEQALPKQIMGTLLENLEAAAQLKLPICQDTGMAVIFCEIGQDVHLTDGDFEAAIHRGVAKGYTEGLLRKSVVRDPFERENTQDNTPAVLHTRIVPGDRVKITVAPKGFGSENMSRMKMFTPAATPEDVMAFVLETVKLAGGNPCPPMVIGVGLGGDFEYCAYLSKKALCRPVQVRNANARYAEMEKTLLNQINQTDIGPQGFGGKTTALAVNIETAATHIAGLPVAVNIGCHVTRHAEIVL